MPASCSRWSCGGGSGPDVPRRSGCTRMPCSPAGWRPPPSSRRSTPWCGSAIFDFEYRIEIYTPEPQRRYGYYSLPVLIGDDIVGRVDLKADRQSSRLLVQSAWWEHGRPANAAERLAEQLRLAAAWQGLEHISISSWGDAADDLAGVMSDAARHEARAGLAALQT